MKLKFIGCGVFKPEVRALVEATEHEIDLEFLPQGLHATPDTLRRELQALVDNTSPEDGYHGIVIGYGLCGRGVAGIMARNLPIIVPRIHDCIACFLGSHRRYVEEFRRHPGTYWFTRGFIESGGQPGVPGKHKGIFKRYETLYEEYRERFGEETARYLVEEWSQGWVKNYKRAAFVNWDYSGVEEDRRITRECADNLGWSYEELPADLSMLRSLLSGRWNPEQFLEVLPGRRIVAVEDARIIDALSSEEQALLDQGNIREETQLLVADASGVLGESGNGESSSPPNTDSLSGNDTPSPLAAGLGIGIDAGGTYTDAVLYDFASTTVLASAKAPTTPADPAVGVAQALDKLDRDRFDEVRLVTLATTFATNAIVENRGGTVGLILIGYDRHSLARITHRPMRWVRGAHALDGTITQPLNELAVRQAAVELAQQDGAVSLAIVEQNGCRNPEFEARARVVAGEVFDGPIQCAHDLTSELDRIRRATTVAVNGRIAPVIVDLVGDVQRVMEDRGIQASLSIVRADGSVMTAGEAHNRPVEMVLSGPAASICGAHALTGLEEAVVLDMGGTTSDVARLSGGRPLRNARGALVGGHRTTVRAPALQTSGLGGDSRIQVDFSGQITVGPRRVLPLGVLAEQEESVHDLLRELHETKLAELSLLPAAELFVLQREPTSRERLSERERQIVSILEDGPANILGLSRGLDYPYLSCISTDNLEANGIVIRSGFTPTDLLHIEGELAWWDASASELALNHLAERAGQKPDELAGAVRLRIEQNLVRLLVSTGLGLDEPEMLETDRLAARLFESAITGDADGIVKAGLALTVPVIGIGAPAHSFVPQAARTLGVDAVIPNRAGVAGAVGAITGSVVESVTVLITPTPTGFTVHAPDQAKNFTLLDTARTYAKERAVDLVHRKALGAGADRFFIRLRIEDRKAPVSDGGMIYIDTEIKAEAAGAPHVSQGADPAEN